MGTYDVYAFCNECSDIHCMGKGITLEDGPAGKESLGRAYAGKELPPDIAVLLKSRHQCPQTKKIFVQGDTDEVFLVPVVFL
jgi:hypothetical protein